MAIAGGTAALFYMIFQSPRVPFVLNSSGAAWITNPTPVRPETIFTGPVATDPAVFAQDFRLDDLPTVATAYVKALGTVELVVNDKAIAVEGGGRTCLKSVCRAGIATVLRRGTNRIQARVANAVGPPLLWLQIQGLGFPVATSPGWRVSVRGSDPAFAVLADDTRTYAEALDELSSVQALHRVGFSVAAVCAFSALLYLLGDRYLPDRLLRSFPELALGLLTLFWCFLFVTKFVRIPLGFGYDGSFHVQYIRFLLEHRSLPLATDGFSMYHPPAFYLITAALMALLNPLTGPAGEPWILKLVPFLSGLGMIWITYSLASRLFERDRRAVFFAVVTAGMLPLNIYMSAYVSNEPFLALMVGLTLLFAVRLLLSGRPTRMALAWLSGLLGFTVLTKYTGLLVAPVVAFFVAFKLFFVDRKNLGHAITVLGGLFLGSALIGGWFYLRNWLHFGDALIWNLDLPRPLLGNWYSCGGPIVCTVEHPLTYWQPPGYHMPQYFLGFGESFRHPYYSGFHSFWDAMYSTVWGEGLPTLAGSPYRHGQWDSRLMSIGYLLALPATAILVLGVAQTVGMALTEVDLGRRCVFMLLLAVLYVIGLSLIAAILRYPFWGAARAAYALSIVVPAAICSGVGLSTLDRWLVSSHSRLLRAVFYGWYGTFVTIIALTFGA